MPAFKMKAKSITNRVTEGSCLHVCRKSSKISKNSNSFDHETAKLDTSIRNCENGSGKVEMIAEEVGSHEGSGHRALCNPEIIEDPGSIERLECLPSMCSSNLETTFSPIEELNANNCKSNAKDYPGSDDDHILAQFTAADGCHNSFGNHTSHVLDLLIANKCVDGLPFNEIYGFDNIMKDNLFPDFGCVETDIMFDIIDSMMLPSLEEATETITTRYEGSYEEFQENTDNSWFHLVSHQIKPSNQEHFTSNPDDADGADHFDPQFFLRNIPELSDVGADLLPALPVETFKRKRVTLVLDLDETLVHSTLESSDSADFTIQVFFNMKDHTVYVQQRPFLRTFLERAAEMFEIVVFTASQSIYAEPLLDILDPVGKFFSRRAYRESCILSDGCYIKDLTVLGYDLAKVAIIDNSPQAFQLQVDNGIPIKSWYDDPSDRALISLLPFLETLVDVEDVRPIIAKRFGVKN